MVLKLKKGTKSVLFGAHCILLHPFFVAWAWKKLYGWPWHPMLWVSFFVHDIGYIGKENMDDEKGEEHPITGALIAGYIRGLFILPWTSKEDADRKRDEWYEFNLLHSRFYCRRLEKSPSRLCFADKLSICYTPAWLYLPMVNWSGEIEEYMQLAREGKYVTMNVDAASQREWYANIQGYLRKWVEENNV